MSRDNDICERIRRTRQSGNTRCDVVGGRMSVADAARAFGLADDGAIYRAIGAIEAQEIATRALSADLAYGSTIMSIPDAAELWRQFVALFDEQNVEFFSNAAAIPKAWIVTQKAINIHAMNSFESIIKNFGLRFF